MSYALVMKKPDAAPPAKATVPAKGKGKIPVGAEHDTYEQEADRVADHAVRGGRPAERAAWSLSKIGIQPVQRQTAPTTEEEKKNHHSGSTTIQDKLGEIARKFVDPTKNPHAQVPPSNQDPHTGTGMDSQFKKGFDQDTGTKGAAITVPLDYLGRAKPKPKHEKDVEPPTQATAPTPAPVQAVPQKSVPPTPPIKTWGGVVGEHEVVDRDESFRKNARERIRKAMPGGSGFAPLDLTPPKLGTGPSTVDPLAKPGTQDASARPESKKEERVQPKSSRPMAGEVDRGLIDPIIGTSGRPLDPVARRYMESRIGYDFSRVRIHADGHAGESARAIGARAYTVGNHIVFGESRYSPNSAEGRRLLAHELTHVVQQDPSVKRVAPQLPMPAISHAPVSVQRDGEDEHSGFLDELWKKLRGLATNIPGYKLFSVILGRDPISGDHVERNAMNVVEGVCGLVPGGAAAFANLKESGALDKAFAWLDDEITKLGLSWAYFKGILKRASEAFSWTDVLHPGGALERTVRFFKEPFDKLVQFAKDALDKLAEIVVSVALEKMGGQKVLDLLKKIGSTFKLIYNDPVKFLKNLLTAVGQGFQQFLKNILEHLKQGLMQWVFGEVAKAGIQLPQKWDLAGIVGLVLQILGISYAKIREKIVKVIGPKAVSFIETALPFLVTLVKDGFGAAWKMILEKATDLIDTVIGGVRDWAVTKIITAAITKLVTMFNPVGAILQAIVVTYDTITFFLDKLNQIMDLVNSILDSITEIATGNLTKAANFVEATMAKTLPVIIGFLAGLIHLDGIGKKIGDIIKKIQAKVDAAIDKVIAWIVEKGKALFEKAKDAAGKALAWWKMSRKADIDGSEGTMKMEGTEDAPALVIYTSPGTPYLEFLKQYKPQDAETQKYYDAAVIKAAELVKPYPKGSDGAEKDAQALKKKQLFDELAELLSHLEYTPRDKPRAVFTYGGLSQLGGGVSATASTLTKDQPPEPEKPGDDAEIWSGMPTIRTKKSYVQGHLLSYHFGGINKRLNLTTLNQSSNGLMRSRIEDPVKDRLKRGRVLYYHVDAIYRKQRKTTAYALEEKNAKPGKPPSKRFKELEVERNMCVSINYEVYEQKYLRDGKWVRRKKQREQPLKEKIPTSIED